jgi:hypothetical protein
MLRDDGALNKFFLMYLFIDNVMSIEFFLQWSRLLSASPHTGTDTFSTDHL